MISACVYSVLSSRARSQYKAPQLEMMTCVYLDITRQQLPSSLEPEKEIHGLRTWMAEATQVWGARNKIWRRNITQPHGLQHTRLPCLSLPPGVCSNLCPSSQWCYPTISSSASLFSLCLQSFPALGFFPSESALHIRWPKYWSFSFSISPSNEYSGFLSDGFTITQRPITNPRRWGILMREQSPHSPKQHLERGACRMCHSDDHPLLQPLQPSRNLRKVQRGGDGEGVLESAFKVLQVLQ